jgi:uncharacterized membrane protein HdeD (DUF308 family)
MKKKINKMDYKSLFLGIVSFIAGILYLIYLKKCLEKENTDSMNLPDKFREFRGFAASLCLVIIGVIMIYRGIISFF